MSWLATRWASAVDEWNVRPVDRESALVLAERGRARLTSLEPGLVVGTVEDRVIRDVQIGSARLSESAVTLVAGQLAGAPPLLAAVMTGRLPAEIDGLLLSEGMDLVPGLTDLLFECSCGAHEQPCRHGLALAIEVGRMSGSEPFVVGLLRGLDRNRLLELAHTRRGRSGPGGAVRHPRGPDPGTGASAAYRRDPSPLPPSGLVPTVAATPSPIEPRPPLDSGLVGSDLSGLVGDAAERAVSLLLGESECALRYPVATDLARRARATVASGGDLDALAEAAGVEAAALGESARCFDVGGEAALAVASDRWEGSDEAMEPGRSRFDPPGRVSANTVTSGSVQLRLDQAGYWWRFEASDSDGWVLSSGGFVDPADALDDDLSQLGVGGETG